jgi:hypothetical protein
MPRSWLGVPRPGANAPRCAPGVLQVLLRALRSHRGEILFFVMLQCATFDLMTRPWISNTRTDRHFSQVTSRNFRVSSIKMSGWS